MGEIFGNRPFLRLLLPFCAGILLHKASGHRELWLPAFAVALSVVALAALSHKFSAGKKIIFVIVIDVFLLLFGYESARLTHSPNHHRHYTHFVSETEEQQVLAEVCATPVVRGKYVRAEVLVVQVFSGSGWVASEGRMLAYFRKGSTVPQAGQQFQLRAKLIPAERTKNPYEFDYAQFLANRQIFHTAFPEPESLRMIAGPSIQPPIWLQALRLKQLVIHKLQNSGLEEDAANICCALIAGYDDELNRDTSEAFAHSGTLHVLSVSGLHTGLIYSVLMFFLALADRHNRFPALRFFIVAAFLWFFALLTGFHPPVVRAVIMFTLLGCGKLFFRSNSRNQLNILFASAFFMLCYNPNYIWETGFLLSFSAVGGILAFQPFIGSLWQPGNVFLRWIWSSVSASLAATISTMPVTLYVFKQFPLWFAFANLIVVPAAFGVLLLAVLLLFNLPLAGFINGIIKALLLFVNLFNNPGWGYLDMIDFRFTDALLLSFFILLLSLSLYLRSHRMLVLSLCAVLVWSCSSLLQSFAAKSSSFLTVYQIRKASALSVKNRRLAYFTPTSKNDFVYHLRPHLTSFNYPDTLKRSFNLVSSGATHVLVLNERGKWPSVSTKQITHLILCNNFSLKEEDISRFPLLREVISDGSNNYRCAEKMAGLCSKFGIEYYETSKRGALKANL